MRLLGLVAAAFGCLLAACGGGSTEAPPPAYGPYGPGAGNGGGPPPAYGGNPGYAGPSGPAPAYPGGTYAGEPPTFGIPTSGGWTLWEMERWKEMAEAAKARLDHMNSDCNTRIGGGFVFETFRGHFVHGEPYGQSSNTSLTVNAPMEALGKLCSEGEMEQKAVRSKIQRIEVRWGGVGNSSFTVSGPVLLTTINPAGQEHWDAFSDNIRSGIRNYL